MKRIGADEEAVVSARACIEGEAACKVALLLKREFGLTFGDAEATLCGGVLTVYVRDALTPMGRLIARTEGGGQVLQGVYDVLHEAHREQLHGLIACISGLPVRRSRIEVDTAAEAISVRFDLCRDLGQPTPDPVRQVPTSGRK